MVDLGTDLMIFTMSCLVMGMIVVDIFFGGGG